MNPGRLIIDSAAEGPRNMAIDQALLEEVDSGAPVTLRFYAWDRPTLSLGYFQAAADRSQHAESGTAELVRRTTGGGAILHDCELTYSLCVPIRDRTSPEVRGVYDAMHRAIIAALADYGIQAVRFADTAEASKASPSGRDSTGLGCGAGDVDQGSGGGAASGREPFLCFQRRTGEDLIVAGYKVVGSAQRRAARAVLQHGSVLLAASRSAPQLPGLFQLTSTKLEFEALAGRIAVHAASRFGVAWEAAAVPESVQTRGAHLVHARFAADDWTFRR